MQRGFYDYDDSYKELILVPVVNSRLPSFKNSEEWNMDSENQIINNEEKMQIVFLIAPLNCNKKFWHHLVNKNRIIIIITMIIIEACHSMLPTKDPSYLFHKRKSKFKLTVTILTEKGRKEICFLFRFYISTVENTKVIRTHQQLQI